MQKDIHPNYHTKAKITCACGASFDTSSTLESIKVEICSQCHPFYTGKQKLVDTARRVEKFEAKSAKSVETSNQRKGKTAKKAALKEKRSTKVGVRKVTTKKIGSGRKKANDAKKPAQTKKADTPEKASEQQQDAK